MIYFCLNINNFRTILLKYRKKEPLKEVQNNKIANVADSVLLSLFMKDIFLLTEQEKKEIVFFFFQGIPYLNEKVQIQIGKHNLFNVKRLP